MIKHSIGIGVRFVQSREKARCVFIRHVGDPGHGATPGGRYRANWARKRSDGKALRACARKGPLAAFETRLPATPPILFRRALDYFEPSAHQWESEMLNLRRRMLGALAFILLVTLVGIVVFSIIDPDAGFIREFFMTAITLTTVG